MSNDGEVYWSSLQPRLEALTERLDYIEKYLVELGRVVGHSYGPYSTGLPAEVAELVRAGETLKALTLYRKLTNASLDQAKAALAKAAAGSI